MSRRRWVNRVATVRNGRRYSRCGLRGYVARNTHARTATRNRLASRRAGLLPGATLALIALFSIFVLGRPPSPPDDPQRRPPIVGVAHYTFADFANASR